MKVLILLQLLFMFSNVTYGETRLEPIDCSGCHVGAGSCYYDGNRRSGRQCTSPVNGQCPAGFTQCTEEVECEGIECILGTVHNSGHTLDIKMGGYEDGLYVCKVEILGHECKLDDAKTEADFLAVDGVVVPNKTSVEFPAPSLSTNGSSDNQSTELHLNSFRFGTMYKVTYCYDFNRVVTTPLVSNPHALNQKGELTGYINSKVALTEYTDRAGVYGELSYECNDTLGFVAADSEDILDFSLNSTTTLDVNAIFDLGLNTTGSCVFEATYYEGNVGDIRPVNKNSNDGLWRGTIQTNVHLEMDLIQN